jgi:hypothetical protein
MSANGSAETGEQYEVHIDSTTAGLYRRPGSFLTLQLHRARAAYGSAFHARSPRARISQEGGGESEWTRAKPGEKIGSNVAVNLPPPISGDVRDIAGRAVGVGGSSIDRARQVKGRRSQGFRPPEAGRRGVGVPVDAWRRVLGLALRTAGTKKAPGGESWSREPGGGQTKRPVFAPVDATELLQCLPAWRRQWPTAHSVNPPKRQSRIWGS